MQLKKRIKRQSRTTRIAAIREWLTRNPDDASAHARLEQLQGEKPQPETEEYDYE